MVVAGHSLNATAIDLVGLAQTGVEYTPYWSLHFRCAGDVAHGCSSFSNYVILI